MPDHTLDVTGLTCPLPVLKANKALRPLPPGATLLVLATDPASAEDFPVFCRETGTELVESSNDGAVYRFLLRKLAVT